jgi:uncharacterized cupredoxin-like copper-binding protein
VGAVQRLATVVIIGLVGLATVLMLYLADESNRQDAETEEQNHAAIERAIPDYVQYCLQCHGPAGEGAQTPGEQGTGRIGMPLGGNTYATKLNQEGIQADGTPWPGGLQARAEYLSETIHEGRGAMPNWGAETGGELTDDQINNLVYMIQHVDWNEVYNEAVEASGGYPTAPPGMTPMAAAAASPVAPGETAPVALDAVDINWIPKEITIGTGPQTIAITNKGASLHDFTIDALDIKVDLPVGETTNVNIEAPPGTYEFYCSVPGHREAGMVGTLVVEEGAGPPAQPPAEGGTPEEGDGEAAAPITVELQDIRFVPPDITVPADTPTTVTLSNTGASPHTFTVPDLGIDEELQAGETREIEINAPAGSYKLVCTIPGHEAAGMVGTIMVE